MSTVDWLSASNIAWVENILNFTKSYYRVTSSEGDQFEYLVPCPPGYTSATKAYWTTDVIVLEPSCSWQTPTISEDSSYWSLSNDASGWDVTLNESDLVVLIANESFGMFLLPSNFFMCSLDFSVNPKYDASFIFRVQKQKFIPNSPCGWFSTFCHRSTCHLWTQIWRDNRHGPILHPDTQ